MSYKFEIIEKDKLVVRDTTIVDVTESIVLDMPLSDAYYSSRELKDDIVFIYDKNAVNASASRVWSGDLSACINDQDAPFTKDSFRLWANTKLGFDNASAGATMGWFDYNDLATQTTPITIIGGGGFVDLTNDELGSFTNKLFPPIGVTDVYDASLNNFDFTQLKLGDTVDIRLDLEVTTSFVNTEVDVILLMADGLGSYPTPFLSQQNYKNTGSYDVNRYNGVYMGDLNTLNNTAKFQIRADKTCEVVVRGWYCKVTQR